MKSNDIIKAVQLILNSKSGLVPMLRGKPGVGKSAIVYQIAKRLNLPVIEFRPCLHDPIDLMGIPSNVDGKTKWLIPSWLPTSGEGILFIDEFPQAAPAMQNALSQLIYGGTLGEYKLPKGWKIILAGNRQSDKAATFRMPSHISNRITFLDVEYNTDDWCEWAIANKLPSSMIAFARYRPKVMDDFDPNREINCTPRTFSEVADFIDFPEGIRYDVMSGTIGEGATVEFESFLRVCGKISTFEEIIENPTKIEIPKKMDEIYATVQMLAEHTDIKTIPLVAKFVDRLEPEFIIVFFKSWRQMNEGKMSIIDMVNIPQIDAWINKITGIMN